MRILIADDDRQFLRFAETTLKQRTPHEVITVNDGAQALERALTESPDVLVLDWLMPKMNGTEVCRLLRAQSAQPELYVLFVTARGRREEMIECLNAGADDLLVKPVPPDVLVARVELANQRFGVDASAARVRQALLLASQQGDGELVVRSDDLSARVFFYQGKVAWSHISDGSGTFLQDLALERSWDRDTINGIVDECRQRGATLTDVLVAWELMDASTLRSSLAAWISRKLSAIVQLPHARSLFLPQRTDYSGDLLFELSELISLDPLAHTRSQSAHPFSNQPSLIPRGGWRQAFVLSPQAPEDVAKMLDSCMELEGLLGVVALERSTGYCLGMRGVELNPDVAWAHLGCLNAVMRVGAVQDSVVTTEDHYHMARVVPGHREIFVYALVDASKCQLALARLKLQQAAALGS